MDIMQSVEKVNAILQAGEPGNISEDTHSGYTGYEPQSIIDAMNEGFGIGAWGFDELSSEIIAGDKGELAVAKIQVWLAGVEFRPAAWGQNRVTRGDMGDARKGAQTDAIKKALSYFSIGNRAYHGLLDGKKQAPAPRPQPKQSIAAVPTPQQAQDEPAIENMTQAINRCRYRGTKHGLKTIAQYEAHCRAIIGKDQPETSTDVIKLNADFDAREKKAS